MKDGLFLDQCVCVWCVGSSSIIDLINADLTDLIQHKSSQLL